MRSNEQALCEAMVRLLEQDTGLNRYDVTYPERGPSDSPVEMRFRLGERRFAIEHTLIEPFPNAIKSAKQFDDFAAEIEAELNGTLPSPGIYYLSFPLHPMAGRHRKTHPELRAKIVDWVRGQSEALHAECPERPDRHHRPHGYNRTVATEIDGLQLSLTRVVHWSESGRHDGALCISRTTSGPIEDQRRLRITTALGKKLPKLEKCHDKGDCTILVLEYSDIALSNHVLIAEAVEATLPSHEYWPDHIYLAETIIERSWQFFRMLLDRQFNLEMRYVEVPKG